MPAQDICKCFNHSSIRIIFSMTLALANFRLTCFLPPQRRVRSLELSHLINGRRAVFDIRVFNTQPLDNQERRSPAVRHFNSEGKGPRHGENTRCEHR